MGFVVEKIGGQVVEAMEIAGGLVVDLVERTGGAGLVPVPGVVHCSNGGTALVLLLFLMLWEGLHVVEARGSWDRSPGPASFTFDSVLLAIPINERSAVLLLHGWVRRVCLVGGGVASWRERTRIMVRGFPFSFLREGGGFSSACVRARASFSVFRFRQGQGGERLQ